MANILKVHEQNTIQQLAAQGWSRRRIARELKLDRKTVRRYLSAAAKSPTISTPGSRSQPSQNPLFRPRRTDGRRPGHDGVGAEAGRPSFCDPHRARIEAKLNAGLSAQRIYQDLVAEVGFSGSYQSIKRSCADFAINSLSGCGASRSSRGRKRKLISARGPRWSTPMADTVGPGSCGWS